MKAAVLRLLPSIIVAFGLIVGGYLAGGRYQLVPSQANTVARLDRFSGTVQMCIVGTSAEACGFVVDATPTK